jgi:hypothetical protein
MPHLSVPSAVVVVVDWQERLLPAMPQALQEAATRRAEAIVALAADLEIPVLRTEQYPKGLGPTVPSLRGAPTFEKITFSALGSSEFAQALVEAGRRQVLLLGMETHICVAQTACDLIGVGYQVHLLADACLSRRKLDWKVGVDKVRSEGARIATVESIGFELLGLAGTPTLMAFRQRIR